MEQQEVKEMLEKQMRLLSERSEKDPADLVPLSHALCETVSQWVRYFTEEGRLMFSYYGGTASEPVSPPQSDSASEWAV